MTAETNPTKMQNMVPGGGLATLICIYQPLILGEAWAWENEAQMLMALAGWTGLFSTILAGMKYLRNGKAEPKPQLPGDAPGKGD